MLKRLNQARVGGGGIYGVNMNIRWKWGGGGGENVWSKHEYQVEVRWGGKCMR